MAVVGLRFETSLALPSIPATGYAIVTEACRDFLQTRLPGLEALLCLHFALWYRCGFGMRSSVQNNSNIPAAMNFTVSPRLASGQPRSQLDYFPLNLARFSPYSRMGGPRYCHGYQGNRNGDTHQSPPRVRETMHMKRN